MKFTVVFRLQLLFVFFLNVSVIAQGFPHHHIDGRLNDKNLMNYDYDPLWAYRSPGWVGEHGVRKVFQSAKTYERRGQDSVLRNTWGMDTIEYDRSGKRIRWSNEVKREFIFDTSAHLVQVKTKYNNVFFEYDSAGNMVRETNVDASGKFYKRSVHEYDTNGRLVFSKGYDFRPNVSIPNQVDTILTTSVGYFYDDNGRIVRQEWHSVDQYKVWTTRTFTYTYTDSMIMYRRLSLHGDEAYVKFDTSGNMLEYLIYDSILDQRDSAFFTYKNGVLIAKRQHYIRLGYAGTGQIYTTYAYTKEGLLWKERAVYELDVARTINVINFTYSFYK